MSKRKRPSTMKMCDDPRGCFHCRYKDCVNGSHAKTKWEEDHAQALSTVIPHSKRNRKGVASC